MGVGVNVVAVVFWVQNDFYNKCSILHTFLLMNFKNDLNKIVKEIKRKSEVY